MTTQNATIVFEIKGELPEGFTASSEDLPADILEKLFGGTEAVNEACCGNEDTCVADGISEPGACATDENAGRLNGFPDWVWPQPEQETGEDDVDMKAVYEKSVDYELDSMRRTIQWIANVNPDQQVLQYVLEADGALEDAQQHIAETAEQAALQAEEDEVVDEWRIAFLQSTKATANNMIPDWKFMAEDTRTMWRERFYGNLEWLERFAKEDK